MIFPSPGEENTLPVFEKVNQALAATAIDTVVIASKRGTTALAAAEALQNCRIVVVTTCTGSRQENVQAMPDSVRHELIDKGCSVVTAAHALGGVGRAVRNRFSAIQTDELIAYTLRLFGQGTKVAVEIAMMAVDCGAVRSDQRIISIGGSSTGADTALILKPANSHRFFDIKIDEILCKPMVSGL